MSIVRRWDPFGVPANDPSWPSGRLGAVLRSELAAAGPNMDMYESDARFAQRIDGFGAGLTAYVVAAYLATRVC